MYLLNYLAFFLITLVTGQQYKTLSYSGKQLTKILDPPDAPPIVYLQGKKKFIDQVPEARWFWSGPGNDLQCPMSITFEDYIQIKCLRQPVVLYVIADDNFNATFLGFHLSGNNYSHVYNFTLNPSSLICNGTYTFAITATNNEYVNKTGCFKNPAGVIYGVMQYNGGGCCGGLEFYSTSTCECYPCTILSPYCITCLNQTICSTCKIGYVVLNGNCRSVCGDSIRTQNEQCDDGNNLNNDGCSQNCLINKHFQCSTILQQQSQCKFIGQFRIFTKQVIKREYQNYITIVFKIHPNLEFVEIDFLHIFDKPNNSLKDEKFTYYEDGDLHLCYSYFNTLQQSIQTFVFNPALIGLKFNQSKSLDINVSMITNQNIPIVHYSESIYTLSYYFSLWFSILFYISLVILFISFVSNKIIGIEMFRVLQISFYSLGYVNNIHPLLTSIFNITFISGYNMEFNSQHTKVSNRINAIHYSSNIQTNINFTLLLFLLTIFVGIWAKILTVILKKKKMLLNEIYQKIIKTNLLFVTLLISMNMWFNIGVQIKYGQFTLLPIMLMFIIITISLLVFILLQFQKTSTFQKSNNFIKNSLLLKRYLQLSYICTLSTGFMISFFNDTILVSFIIFSIYVFLLVFQLSNLIYNFGIHNYRANFNTFTICSILFIRMFYNNNQEYMISESFILCTSIFQFVMISVCVILSIACLVYQYFQKQRLMLSIFNDNLFSKEQTQKDTLKPFKKSIYKDKLSKQTQINRKQTQQNLSQIQYQVIISESTQN